MSDLPACPQCGCSYTYADRAHYICPECAHEWSGIDEAQLASAIRDANGNELHSGDTVTVIRDLRVKGASSVVKVGTKVKNIRLLDPDYVSDGHDIDCRIDGFGPMKLKSSVVKKA